MHGRGWLQASGRWIYQFQTSNKGYTLLVTNGKKVLVEDKTKEAVRQLSDTLGNEFYLSEEASFNAFYEGLSSALSAQKNNINDQECIEVNHKLWGSSLKWQFHLVEADAARTDVVLRSVCDGLLGAIVNLHGALLRESAQLKHRDHQVQRLLELAGPGHDLDIFKSAASDLTADTRTGLEIAQVYWPEQNLMELADSTDLQIEEAAQSNIPNQADAPKQFDASREPDTPDRAATPETASEDETEAVGVSSTFNKPLSPDPALVRPHPPIEHLSTKRRAEQSPKQKPQPVEAGADRLVRQHKARRLKF